MDKKIKKIILFLGMFFAFFFSAGFVFALEVQYPTILGFSVGDTLPEYARYFFNIGIVLAGFIAVGSIAFGGIYYLLSFARGKFTDEGKDWIKSGTLGLILTVSAYLIAYTINPDLVIFRLNGLVPIIVNNPLSNSSPNSPGAVTYSEIPIGTLTENLVSRAMDCYNYDGNGNPIEGEQITTDDNKTIKGPTYLDHDRVDCFAKLAQAAAAKALVIKNLGNEIANLMKQCSCGGGGSGSSSSSSSSSGSSSEGGDCRKDKTCPAGTMCNILTGNCTSIILNKSDSNNNSQYESGVGGLPLNSILLADNSLCPNGTGCSSDHVCVNGVCVLSNGSGKPTAQCEPTCDPKACTDANPVDDGNGSCPSPCSGGSGKCKTPSGVDNCCPTGIKDKAENGPIKLKDCNDTEIEYKGLKEFRSEFNDNYDAIKNKVEVSPPPQFNGKPISVIILGNCQTCNNNCPACIDACSLCDPKSALCKTQCVKDNTACKTNSTQCQKNKTDCNKARLSCLKSSSPWYNLRLVDQLTYLRGKMNEIKNGVKKDLEQLTQAKSSLGQCYLADSYIDFLKTFQETNAQEKTVLIQRNFSDPITQKKIIPAKYCKGFEYNNSTCYTQCKKICPESLQSIQNMSNCQVCDSKNMNKTEYTKCMNDQNTCLKEKQGQQQCIYGTFGTFSKCMDSCKQQCLNLCQQDCGDDKNLCIEDCNNNSQCLLNNENTCLLDVQSLKNCVNNYKDDESVKKCAENSALCPYCSDQYAGYPECLKNPYSLQDKYSSSFIYQNPNYQICPEPYRAVNLNANNSSTANNSVCLNLNPETAKCPADSKCPLCPCDIMGEIKYRATTSQDCGGGGGNNSSSSSGSSGGSECACTGGIPGTPSCYPPCSSSSYNNLNNKSNAGIGGVAFNLVTVASSGGTCNSTTYCGGGMTCVNGQCVSGGGSNSSSNSSGGGARTDKKEYKVCSGNCDTFAYNDDPLTFYCQDSWWLKQETKRTAAVGSDRICSKEGEIPSGKMVDDAEKWGQDFLDSIDKVTKPVDDLSEYMKKIAKKTGYCRCDSVCENGKSACGTDCKYNPPSVATGVDSETGETIQIPIPPSCSFIPCNGNPCQLMLDLLLGSACGKGCAQGEGLAYFYDQINNGAKDFLNWALRQTRSDIVKELNYSRAQVNSCSKVQNNYGTQTRMLSCTRVEDETISPIIGTSKPGVAIANGLATSSYCYGKAFGIISGSDTPLSDNWFCCQEKQQGGTKLQQNQQQE